jgi:ATP-dependent RNA helicase DDX10/DBP4
MPSEEEDMLAALAEKKVPLQHRTFASKKVTPITSALTALLAKSEELKTTAQAAFASYVRSVFLNPNKSIFDISKLDLEEFAASLGLPTMPRVHMVKKLQKQTRRLVAAGALDGNDGANRSKAHPAHERQNREARHASPEGASSNQDEGRLSASDDAGNNVRDKLIQRLEGSGFSRAACWHAAESPPSSSSRSAGGRALSEDDSDADDLLRTKRTNVLAEEGDDTPAIGHRYVCMQNICFLVLCFRSELKSVLLKFASCVFPFFGLFCMLTG